MLQKGLRIFLTIFFVVMALAIAVAVFLGTFPARAQTAVYLPNMQSDDVVEAAAAPGNNGTVKIHENETDEPPVVNNEPHVCKFHIHFFFADPAQEGNWWIESIPPTGNGEEILDGTYDTSSNGEYKTLVMSLPDGHYKLYWEGRNEQNVKHKVFWVECEVQTKTPTPTLTSTPTASPTFSPTPSVTPTGIQDNPTPTATSTSIVTLEPTATSTNSPIVTETPSVTPTPESTKTPIPQPTGPFKLWLPWVGHEQTPTPIVELKKFLVCHIWGDPYKWCYIVIGREPEYEAHPHHTDEGVEHPIWGEGWHAVNGAKIYVEEIEKHDVRVEIATGVDPSEDGASTSDGGKVFHRVEPTWGHDNALHVVVWTPLEEASASSYEDNLVQNFVDMLK